MKTISTITFAAAMLSGIAPWSQAAESRFNGTVDTAWTNPANWSAGLPGAADSARLQENKTAVIDTAIEVGALNHRGNANLGGNAIEINAGGSLLANGSATELDGDHRIGVVAGDATLNINSGGSATFEGAGSLTIGRDSGTGYVNVASNATLTIGQGVRVGDNNTGAGGVITINEGGTLLATTNFHLAASAGTFGDLLIEGGDVSLNAEYLESRVGFGGTGSVVMTSGSLDVNGLTVAYNNGSVGSVDLDGGDFSSTGIVLMARANSYAEFNVDGATVDLMEDLQLSTGSGSTGVVSLASGVVRFGPNGDFRITDKDTAYAELNISGGALIATNEGNNVQVRDGYGVINQSGGTMDVSELYVGHLSTSTGEMNMSGGTNHVDQLLVIGNQEKDGLAARGTLNMSGGWMKTPTLKLGAELGTEGTLVMSGSNAFLEATVFRMGDTAVDATSSVDLLGGELKINTWQADNDIANESFHIAGGVLNLRFYQGASNNIILFEDLIDSGVLTWDKGPIGSGRDPASAEIAYTNANDVILYGDLSGTRSYYYWAEALQPIPTYADWAADYGLTTNNNDFADNPDGDSRDNLAEYGLGGDPSDPADTGLFSTASETEMGTNYFIYVYNRRADYVERGLSYALETRGNLVIGSWGTNAYEQVGVSSPFVGALGDEFEAVTNRVAMEGLDQEFTRLNISIEP